MTRRAYIYFALTFLLGIVVGAAGLLFYGWYWGHWQHGFDKQRMVRHLTRELNLSDTQVHQLNEIVYEWAKNYKDLEKQVEPQFEALREARRSRIRQILTPEQLTKFNELVRKSERMKKQKPS